MWLRTGMAGRILLKLVSELKISWNSTIKKSMELLMKEDQHVRNAFHFAGVATAYTLLQLSSSLQLMSTVRFSFSGKIRDLQQKFHVAIISSGWRDVMGIAAIDCALEENMPTCREYEVTNQLWDHNLKKVTESGQPWKTYLTWI